MTAIERLMSELPVDIDAALVTGGYNRRYLTGFVSSAGTLVLTRKRCALIIDSRYFECAEQTVDGCEVILQQKLHEQIMELLNEAGAKTVAVENDSCTLGRYLEYREKLSGVEILDDDRLSKQINRLRRIKTPNELEKLRAAQDYTDRTFEHILGYIKPGITEKEIALELEFHGRSLGAECVSFSFIIASGECSSQPHHVPCERAVRAGDLVTLDFGFMVDGYCSDMTRTIAVGEPDKVQREVYDTVLRAQNAAFEAIRPGVKCSAVDAQARELIDSSPYAGLFGHNLGHSLGLEIHEPPNFSKACDVPLEPGMVLSVEPGIYLPGKFGVRIEDLIVCTENGFENLTRSPKELIVVAGK